LFVSAFAVAKEKVSYIGMTKRQLVARLGLPAEISLETGDAPAREIWWYYWDEPRQGLARADFQFCGNKICGFVSAFDEKRLVSTETSAGFNRVYERVVKERREQHR
jgi:hypothetical protein